MKASLLFTLVIAFSIVCAQDEKGNKVRNNEIATDIMLFSSSLKPNYGFGLETAGLLIAYRRVLVQSGVFGLRGEFGLGFKYPTGESSFFSIPYNLYLKSYIGKKTIHLFQAWGSWVLTVCPLSCQLAIHIGFHPGLHLMLALTLLYGNIKQILTHLILDGCGRIATSNNLCNLDLVIIFKGKR